jgi:hypothetical protein
VTAWTTSAAKGDTQPYRPDEAGKMRRLRAEVEDLVSAMPREESP